MRTVLELLVLAVAPSVVVWVLVRGVPVLADLPDRLAARRTPPAPAHRSFERLVADLHRLRRELRGPAPTTYVRRVALAAAYDDVLDDLCRAVDLDRPRLASLPERERPFARLQTEAALQEAGIPLEHPRAA